MPQGAARMIAHDENQHACKAAVEMPRHAMERDHRQLANEGEAKLFAGLLEALDDGRTILGEAWF
eukprot:CAMPEP_0170333294 /NCGR_PEP_ID=MMETSP0116_2-20130129/67667_1 /TAXON_ID=400756 /ORGANISM="Durinskia baltica, Strain CSIRO CS-38" /LENGTH=64 /DNA_ID=CAMNT_0010586637 /DNA_START=314 /DNA_END=506 /DNA_ORIENTATION=+